MAGKRVDPRIWGFPIGGRKPAIDGGKTLPWTGRIGWEEELKKYVLSAPEIGNEDAPDAGNVDLKLPAEMNGVGAETGANGIVSERWLQIGEEIELRKAGTAGI